MMGKTLRDAARQPISRWLELDALKEAVSWPGASVRPAVVLTSEFIAAERDAEAYGYFHERAEARPDEPLFLALEGTFQARLAAKRMPEALQQLVRHVGHAPGFVAKVAAPEFFAAVAKLDQAVSREPGIRVYFRGADGSEQVQRTARPTPYRSRCTRSCLE
jgi:hypothetical protein